jgi:hypothetical protein
MCTWVTLCPSTFVRLIPLSITVHSMSDMMFFTGPMTQTEHHGCIDRAVSGILLLFTM